MVKHIILWFIMVVGLSFLYVMIGFQDTVFVILCIILYAVVFHLHRVVPGKPQKVLVEATRCEVCGEVRKLDDFDTYIASESFDSGKVERSVIYCNDKKKCEDGALAIADKWLAQFKK